MASSPLPQAFEFLLKYDNASRNRRRRRICIIILVIISILILSGIATFLVNKYVISDEESVESDQELNESDCQVIQIKDNKLTPCQFPFGVNGKLFYNCTTENIGRFWCSTKVGYGFISSTE